MRGSSAPHIADLIVTALRARPSMVTPNDNLVTLGDELRISREYPADPSSFASPDGTLDAIWIGRESRQDVDIEGTHRFIGTNLITDEVYTLWLTVQSLRNDSAGTQKVAVDRANLLLGEVLAEQASDPSWGFADTTEFTTFFPRGISSTLRTGRLDAGHGAAFEVGLRFQCRVHLS